MDQDVLIRVLFEKLSDFFAKSTLIIFGSAVEKLHKGSDIDLLMVGNEDISGLKKDFEDIYNKKIHLIQVKSMNCMTDALFHEIRNRHMILNNTETIVRIFGGRIR